MEGGAQCGVFRPLFMLVVPQVGWVKTDTKAIQAIGEHVITHNNRVSVSHDREKHHLHITRATLEDAGQYMCQLNTPTMKSQVSEKSALSHCQTA